MYFKRTREFQLLLATLIMSKALLAMSFTEPALAQGKLITDTITSPSLEGNLPSDSAKKDLTIYLPPSYDTSDRRYPVAYLLPGWGNVTFNPAWDDPFVTSDDVPEGGLDGMFDDMIATGELKEMIIVIPDGNNKYGGSCYTNSEVTGNNEDYIVQDIVSYIDAHYRTIPSRDSRAIGGSSMGGDGAMKLAMKHPDMFSAVAAHGPLLYFEAMKPMIPLVIAENPDGMMGPSVEKLATSLIYAMAAAFSPNTENPPFYVDLPFEYPGGEIIDSVWNRWLEHEPFTMLSTYGDNLASLRGIHFEAGDKDEFGCNYSVEAFHQALAAVGIEHEYAIYDGGHSDKFYDRLPILVKFLSDVLVTEAEANKAVRLRLYEEINKGNFDIFDELYADELKEEMKQTFVSLRAGFPDFHFTADDMIAEGDLIATRWTLTGTHTGEFMGIPPTNKQMVVTGIAIARMVNGKHQRIWEDFDRLGMMQQLGLFPSTGKEDFGWGEPNIPGTGKGDPEVGKALHRRLFEEVWNQGNLDVVDEIYVPDFINNLGIPGGREGFKQYVAANRAIFPDVNYTIDLQLAEGDIVVTRWTVTGTHQGEFMGIPPTGVKAKMTGITMSRIADGRIAESWNSIDMLGLIQQLQGAAVAQGNKALVRRRYDEIWNQKNLSVGDELLSDNYVYHDPDGNLDRDGRGQQIAMTIAAFPDLHWTVEDQIAEGDMVATRLTITGTHKGELMGIPPTDVHAVMAGITLDRIADGKIAETWTIYNKLGMMQQLGVIPSDGKYYTWGEPSEVTGDPGDPETNKAISGRVFDEMWNQGNPDVIDEIYSTDYVGHVINSPELHGTVGVKQIVTAYRVAFPDLHFTIEAKIAEGDKVVTYWTVSGTHQGEFMGIPPTGKQFEGPGIDIHRIANGKIVEAWGILDNFGTLQQIGVIPTPKPPVDIEANKAVVLRRFEIANQRNLDEIDEIMTADSVDHDVFGDYIGIEARKQEWVARFDDYPDIHWTVEDIIAEGDRVATRITVTGTHQATGAHGTVTGIIIDRIVDGKIAETWSSYDALGMMQQLGVIPMMGRKDFTWGEPSKVIGDQGSPEENKEIARRYLVELFSEAKLEVADEIIAVDYIRHDPANPVVGVLGPEGIKQYVSEYHAAFPDIRNNIESIFAEGDKVVSRCIVTGTHKGVFKGIPPTGKYGEIPAIMIFRIADGKIIESWFAFDTLGMMQQLGVIPKMEPEDFSNVFFMPLTPGLNMISLPLKPQTPYTARSFAEKLSATAVIKIDEKRQRFVGFTLDAPDDGFAIEGGKGYIVNVPKGGMVAFTGAAWTRPPMPAAPEIQTDGAWAFVVSGRLEEDAQTSEVSGDFGSLYLVTVRNTRTNAVATDVVREGYFAAAFADLNRQNVVQIGDRLEIQVGDKSGEIASETFTYTVTGESIRQAFLPIILRNVGIPRQSLLLQNYPNPFNPETWIPYQLREPAEVVIRIYNAKGQLVRTFDLGQRAAGFYFGRTRAAYWDGHNNAGEKVASGIYFYQLQAGDFSSTRRMVVVK